MLHRCVAVVCLLAVFGQAQKPTDASPKDLARKEAALVEAERTLADSTSALRASYDAIEIAVARARAASGAAWITDLARVTESSCTSAREVAGKVGSKERLVQLMRQSVLPAVERIEDADLKLLLPWLRRRVEGLAGAPPLDVGAWTPQAFAGLVLAAPLGDVKFHDLWNNELSPVLPAAESYRKAAAARDAAAWDVSVAKDPLIVHQKGAPPGFAKVPAGKYVAIGNAGFATNGPRAGRKPATVAADVWIALRETTHAEYFAWWKTLDETARRKHVPTDENKQPVWKAGDDKGDPMPSDDQGRHPVTGVLLGSAFAFAASQGARLPTEAEWCAAAGGKDGRAYPWGNDWVEGRCRSADGGAAGPAIVGGYPEGRGPFGHFDLAGNAAEWMATYESGKDIVPAKIDDANAVVRGGSWLFTKNDVGTGWAWYRRALFEQRSDIGFRLAMDVPKAAPR